MKVFDWERIHQVFSIRQSTRRVYQFIAYSFIVTWVLLLAFMSNVTGDIHWLNGLYGVTIPFYYYVLFLVVLTLCLPLLWVKWFLPLIVVPKVIFDIVLIGDFFLFGVYRFHVDMVFINMLLHDFKGVGISLNLVALSVAVAGLVVAINVTIYRRCMQFPKLKLIRTNLVVIGIFVTAQIGHVIAYDYKKVEYTKFTPYFPYYAPLMSTGLMATLKENFPSTFPEVEVSESGQVASILGESGGGLLKYPLQQMQCDATQEQLPNILIYVAESWRYDVMDSEVTPNIAKFANQATQFNRHYSGGNVTVNGLFSLMYGLHPTYRDYMTADAIGNQSLLTKTLAQLGYDIDVYTSSNLDGFLLKPLFFGDIDDDNFHNPLAGTMLENDRDAVNSLLADIQTQKQTGSEKPWFKFVFVSSSHHNYQYPKTSEKFLPVEQNTEKFLFDKDMDPQPLFNRYKNSVHYVDALFGEISDALKTANLMDDTLIMVTSDHGEEFNDNKMGYWGHGNNFTQVQLEVPMFVKQPASDLDRLPSTVNELTSHIDVVPTILAQYAQCQNDLTDYSNGENLFKLPPKRAGLIAASYKDKAYLINDFVYATGLTVDSYSISDLKVKNEKFDYSSLTKLKQQESILLKH